MDRFDDMRMKGINTNDATAAAGDILQGKTAYASGQKITGTLVPGSGGGGADLSKIGTTVTVEAQTSIMKGERWEGVKNTAYNRMLTKEVSELQSNYMSFSSDLEFAVKQSSSSSSVFPTTWIVYMYNKETMGYDEVEIPIPSEIAGQSKASGYTYTRINSEGTLAAVYFNNLPAIIWIEIDRENKTGAAYYEERSEFTSVGTSTRFDKNIIFNSGNHVVYDIETHTSNTYTLTSGTQQFNSTPNNFLITESKVFSLGDGKTLKFFGIGSSQWQTISTITSDSYNSTISPSGNLIVGAVMSSSTQAKLTFYSLNVAGNVATKIAEHTVTITERYKQTYAILLSDNILLFNKNLYDISNIENEPPVLLATGALQPQDNMSIATVKKWIAYQSTTVFHFSDNGEAEYLIYSKNASGTEASKYYGITSQNISIGDSGQAQLLFDTVGGAE